ncbi:hypothetical protein [uncultured Halomonas sp.]|uniref:hypothetical protein n=1 Tax=uncultured Halomonas sp. TaxID=173971 RepID=UPI00260DF8D1|nr:hypothetical protein [uncultured Halomonas sp.]
MTTAPQIPSHIRYMIAAVQDRALDLRLAGRHWVKTELDLNSTYAVFELKTRRDGGIGTVRYAADLGRIVGIDGRQPMEEALDEARRDLAGMIDHLNTLIDQEAAQ